jgi:hypothetical protein
MGAVAASLTEGSSLTSAGDIDDAVNRANFLVFFLDSSA